MYDPTMKQADEDKKSPNGCYGGGGHTKSFLGANVYTQIRSGRRVLVDETAGQICLQADNTNRRKQLQGSEDSLGRQQGAEDAGWPSLARVEGIRQPWMATFLEEGKLQTETKSRQGPSPDLPKGIKTQRKTGVRGIPSWALPPKAENSGPCGVCYPQNRLEWCCPCGS